MAQFDREHPHGEGKTMQSELVRGTYTKEMQENTVKRIGKYAGTTMSSNGNPCITKREAIALADYIRELEQERKSVMS